jgi:phage antirepressor YoqD-like protein
LELRSSSLQRDLTKIHKYFDLFPLKTKKLYDFLLQKEIVYRVSQPNWEQNREQIIALIKRNRGPK